MSVIIIGGGHSAKLLIDILEDNNIPIFGIIDDNESIWGEHILGVKVLGGTNLIIKKFRTEHEYIFSIADPKIKKLIFDKLSYLNLNFINAIHKNCTVSKYAVLGKGIIINAGAIIAANAILEDHVFANFNSTVGHDVIVRRFSSVMPGVNIAGNVTVEECCYLGMDCTVLQDVRINQYAIVGGNALVNKDVDSNTTVVGIPARPIEKRH